MGYLTGKRVLILGVASKLSIASGIAEAMHREGAELAFTYQTDKLKERVLKFAAGWDSDMVYPCDVSSDEQITQLFESVGERWDGIDCIVHCLAFAPGSELDGNYVDVTTREGFLTAHEISSYSFVALAQAGKKLMEGRNGSMLTLSYLGAVRSLPNYNVMGLAKASLEANVRYMSHSLGHKNIRVNGISAGPIKTLAAAGISGFNEILKHVEDKSALRRNVTTVEVANTALFLASESSSGITGQIIYVDCGFNISGV